MVFERSDKEAAREAMADLVAAYEVQASYVESPNAQYTETETRGQFIDKFLQILGWDVHNDGQKLQIDRDVLQEHGGDEEVSVTGRPDYRLRVDGVDRLPVEAKKPSIRLSQHTASAFQARSYGWSLSLPAGVLTNFSETVVFDTTVTPEPTDSAASAVIPGCYFSFSEYVDRFDELWERLSYEVVASARFGLVYSYEEPPRGSSQFDQSFLSEFRRWRAELASNIAAHNALLGEREVGRRTQRLLNALLFLRVCEDRNIQRYEALLESARTKDVLAEFRTADRIFNAGLFDVLDSTKVTADVLLTVIQEMYWPRSKFAFGVLRPDILASVYEQYLAERVVLSQDRTVSVIPKPELTHAGGVVPTPAYIVEELIESALEPISGPVPSDFTLLDPACGSGIFLVTALRKLIELQEASGVEVDLAERARLTQQHLFGVDIDGEAVEVAKLSLLLAVLGEATVDARTTRALLPSLSDNLHIGNTLVDSNFDRIMSRVASLPEVRAAIAPIDLETAFASVFDAGGFSAIVGNPPYIRIQVLKQYFPEQADYFQDVRSGFESSQAFNFDIYMLFVERCLPLLAPGGRLAFIVPNRFTNGLAGAPMRQQIGPRLIRLVHFGVEQVFDNRTTYTALIIVGDPESAPAELEIVSDLSSYADGCRTSSGTLPRELLVGDPWPISSSAQSRVFEKMEQHAIGRLGDADCVEIFVGVQTSANDIFLIKPTETDDHNATFIDPDGQQRQIERALLRPALLDRSIEPYSAEPEPDAMAIFPYTLETDSRDRLRANVIGEAQLASEYPLAHNYFATFADALIHQRSVTPDPGAAYWSYGRSQSLTKLDEPKLIVRTLSRVPRYAIDSRGLVVNGGGDGGPYYLLRPLDGCPYSIRVVQAVLSHPAVDAYVASRGKAYRGSYIVHRKAFLKEVPLPRLDPRDQAMIDASVEEMQGLMRLGFDETDSSLAASYEARSAVLRRELELKISSAFGLDPSDMESLEG